ncbi:hypothetical protein EPI10_028411 [Gossypium australe]|uniref:Retrotransposon gag protein n=1 Tax=Gossypium australe TaxID=47621 RepID=A0A5B6UZW9_9ROSI|nr:hypothetical protein EPI10_028411 [Gossypium australe]
MQVQQFELKPVMFQMLQTVKQFSGLPTEDPKLYLRLFIEVCDSFRKQGVPEDALRLKLFPNSLRDRVRAWLNALLLEIDETLYDVWGRFKDLIRKCLMHGFQHRTQMEIFYNGLNAHIRMVVDAFANGTLLDKYYNEAYEIFLEKIANNDYQYPTTRVGTYKRAAGTMELNPITSLIA